MRILVISDSHGNYAQTFKAHQQAGEVDHIVHLGDGFEDGRLLQEILEAPVIQVAGNCDLGAPLPQERLIRFADTAVFLTHGHRYQVKSGLVLLERRGNEVGARVILYGHTHFPSVETRGGVLFVNPGELKGERGSYAIVTIDDGGARAELFGLEKD